MLNSAACRSKTPRAPAEAPRGKNSSRAKGLMQGHPARYNRTDETSRLVIKGIHSAFPARHMVAFHSGREG